MSLERFGGWSRLWRGKEDEMLMARLCPTLGLGVGDTQCSVLPLEHQQEWRIIRDWTSGL